MSGANGASKPSDNTMFSGTQAPDMTSGLYQTGGFVVPPPTPPTWMQPNAVSNTEGVPAQVKVGVSGAGVVQGAVINQSSCEISLGEGSLQLTGHVYDADNNLTDPPLGTFVWISRNSAVATVFSTGLVTLVGRGECDIECRYSRQANASFLNASPSPTESMAAYATVALVVTA